MVGLPPLLSVPSLGKEEEKTQQLPPSFLPAPWSVVYCRLSLHCAELQLAFSEKRKEVQRTDEASAGNYMKASMVEEAGPSRCSSGPRHMTQLISLKAMETLFVPRTVTGRAPG